MPISQVGSSSQIHSAQSDVISADAGISAANKQVDEAEARLVQAKANAATANADLARYAQLVSKKEMCIRDRSQGPQQHPAASGWQPARGRHQGQPAG